MSTQVFGKTFYLSERDRETLKSLAEDINMSYTYWDEGRYGTEFEVTPRQIGFIRKLLKAMHRSHSNDIQFP